MRVLITNDDGIDSPGLVPLANAAVAAGYEVVVAAPDKEYSGASAAIQGEWEDGGFKIRPGRPAGLDARVESLAIHSSPAMIAYGGALGSFGPRPDLVLSGINLGPNVGPAVAHSGTVGAALTAASMGIPALAVSMSTMSPVHWETAEHVVAQVLANLPAFTARAALNLNVPDVPLPDLLGLRRATVATYAEGAADAAAQFQAMLAGGNYLALAEQLPRESDGALLAQGWATISLVRSVTHVPDADLPTF